MEHSICQNKIAIITKNKNSFISLKTDLNENGVDVCTVSSIENIFEKYIILTSNLSVIQHRQRALPAKGKGFKVSGTALK